MIRRLLSRLSRYPSAKERPLSVEEAELRLVPDSHGVKVLSGDEKSAGEELGDENFPV